MRAMDRLRKVRSKFVSRVSFGSSFVLGVAGWVVRLRIVHVICALYLFASEGEIEMDWFAMLDAGLCCLYLSFAKGASSKMKLCSFAVRSEMGSFAMLASLFSVFAVHF